jgi:hypothetical protein
MIIKIDGYNVLIDDEDHERIKSVKWHCFGNKDRPYFGNTVNLGKGKYTAILLHREIMNASPGTHIDHISGNTLDNRKQNLRICSRAENNCNLKRRVDNTSGYKGVSFDKKKNKWASYISKNKRHHFLGYFDTQESAYIAYCEASKKYHGEYGRIA